MELNVYNGQAAGKSFCAQFFFLMKERRLAHLAHKNLPALVINASVDDANCKFV